MSDAQASERPLSPVRMASKGYSSTLARSSDAVLAAQEAYLETGGTQELLSIYHLFGDPASRLR
jgi:hypothetical protein